MKEHTPTPWFVAGQVKGAGTDWREIHTNSLEFKPSYVGEAINADAEFIVRAVNSHDALLAMAKAYYLTLPDDGPEQDYYAQVIEQAEKGA
jgi:hypothetical protein